MKEISKMAPERCAKLKDFSEHKGIALYSDRVWCMSILDKVYTVKYKRREVVTRYQTRLLNFCWEDGFHFLYKKE